MRWKDRQASAIGTLAWINLGVGTAFMNCWDKVLTADKTSVLSKAIINTEQRFIQRDTYSRPELRSRYDFC